MAKESGGNGKKLVSRRREPLSRLRTIERIQEVLKLYLPHLEKLSKISSDTEKFLRAMRPEAATEIAWLRKIYEDIRNKVDVSDVGAFDKLVETELDDFEARLAESVRDINRNMRGLRRGFKGILHAVNRALEAERRHIREFPDREKRKQERAKKR